MPPIPLHIDDPIAPTKAEGVTPQTQDSPTTTSNLPPTTTAQAQAPPSAYPAARPGAPAVPAPTSSLARPPPAPSRTIAPQYDGPPPPQPGAVPVAPNQQAASTLPPPPKAGETVKQQLGPGITAPPPQANIPAPQQNYAPTHTTTSYQPAPATGPTTINLGPVASPAQPVHSQGLENHPPGYQQNTYAQELSPAQRSSLEQVERKESVFDSLGANGAGEAAGSVWNTVKGYIGAAGKTLAETEERVWKGVGGGGK